MTWQRSTAACAPVRRTVVPQSRLQKVGVPDFVTSVTRYLFTSREFDEDTGLQYNRARWYDPEVGRWVSEDPIGFAAGDGNLARFVGNSPMKSIDPSGMAESDPGALVVYDSDDPGDVFHPEVANGKTFEATAKYLKKEFGYKTVPLDGFGNLLTQVQSAYQGNGEQPITLFILDHGNGTNGQTIDSPRPVKPKDFKPLDPYVNGIVFLGCDVGNAEAFCSEVSVAIDGCVHVCGAQVQYSSNGYFPRPTHRPPWRWWYKGKEKDLKFHRTP